MTKFSLQPGERILYKSVDDHDELKAFGNVECINQSAGEELKNTLISAGSRPGYLVITTRRLVYICNSFLTDFGFYWGTFGVSPLLLGALQSIPTKIGFEVPSSLYKYGNISFKAFSTSDSYELTFNIPFEYAYLREKKIKFVFYKPNCQETSFDPEEFFNKLFEYTSEDLIHLEKESALTVN